MTEQLWQEAKPQLLTAFDVSKYRALTKKRFCNDVIIKFC